MPVIFPSSCSCFFYQAFRVFGGGFSGGGQVLVSEFQEVLVSSDFGFRIFPYILVSEEFWIPGFGLPQEEFAECLANSSVIP